jgi:Predicted membrane protein
MVKYCTKCGAPNEDNALFCSKCGWQITQPASQANENIIIGNREIAITKNRRVEYLVIGPVAILIGIFFASLGFILSNVYSGTYLLELELITGVLIGFGFVILLVGYYLGKTVWVTK